MSASTSNPVGLFDAPAVRVDPASGPSGSSGSSGLSGGGSGDGLGAAVERAAESLLGKQRRDRFGGDGPHWCAELEGDSILSSEYLLMKFILGQADPASPEWSRLLRIANQLRLSQRPDGTWGQYPGSPADVSACVKAYLCLKLMGDGPEQPHMARARERVLAMGGVGAINTFSMFYLACLGVVSWGACPAIPPQIVLLPRWFPFHMSKVAAWTRTMILPLALCSALQPVRPLPGGVNIDELFTDMSHKRRLSKRADRWPLTWKNFFLLADAGMKLCRRVGLTPLRGLSVRRCEGWIKRRMDPSTTEGLGAIFPPMVYAQVAFQKLGYGREHPLIAQAEADLDAFMVDERSADPARDHVRLQPCFSPVWDTAIALDALTEAGRTAASDARVAGACDWLRAREVKLRGDWADNLRRADRGLRPGVDVAMWAFEYRNDWYPDVDDTCMVAKALHRAGDRPGESANRDAARRAVRWVLAMQNDDGGWAAFDRTRDRRWMEAVPFADHNAMQDPSCSDITGRVLESLATCGVAGDHPAVGRAVKYLLATQQPEGCWWGRWGVNYIYGTWQAVNGLAFATIGAEAGRRSVGGEPELWSRVPVAVRGAMERARRWLLSCQNSDGGFGESANSYLDRSLMGKGPSTASQTAWAMITLMHLLPAGDERVAAAGRYLISTQLDRDKRAFQPVTGPAGERVTASADAAGCDVARDPVTEAAGGWCEHPFTGTGFPKVFYLRYNLYRHSFPLKALARWRARGGEKA